MRTRIPPSLKWLVDRRARLSSELERDRREAEYAALRVLALKAKVELLRQDLAAIDRALSMHEVRIHPETIAPLKTWHAERRFKHNHLTRNIMAYLRIAKGHWSSTTELMAYVATQGGIEVTEESYPELRLATRKRLRNLRASGRVIRKHEAKTSKEGYWALSTDECLRSKP